MQDEDKRAKVLIADDDRFFLQVFSDIVESLGHECTTAENGLEALEKAESYSPDIIVLDVVMPGMDGFETTMRLKANPSTNHIPVMIVTSLADRASKIKGLECGADELLSKPVDETEFKVRARNLLKVKRYRDYLLEHGKVLEDEVNEKSIQLKEAFGQIKQAYQETILRLTLAAEQRDKVTGDHIRRIGLYSQSLSRHLGLPEDEVEDIYLASPMHDVGKIGISDSILLKPGKHTEAEFEVMKTHTTIGAQIMSGSDSSILQASEKIALNHHERWNGTGYPNGLRGEEIPISGRIVQIVDIYDAIRSSRPYRLEGYDHPSTIKIIEDNNASGSFDPRVFEAFMDCSTEYRRLFDENCNDHTPVEKDEPNKSVAG